MYVGEEPVPCAVTPIVCVCRLVLCRFDTREFLNVLSLAFEEDFFTTVSFRDPNTGEAVQRPGRQLMVDLLLDLMMKSRDFTPAQVCECAPYSMQQGLVHAEFLPFEVSLCVSVSMCTSCSL